MKMISLMFETFLVKKVYLAPQAVMSLFSTGRTTGLVCDVGDTSSYCIPILEGI
jgi:actin